jgi:hypothetical protein
MEAIGRLLLFGGLAGFLGAGRVATMRFDAPRVTPRQYRKSALRWPASVFSARPVGNRALA